MGFLSSIFSSFFTMFLFTFIVIGGALFPELIPSLMYGAFIGLLGAILYVANKKAVPELLKAKEAGQLAYQEANNTKWKLYNADLDQQWKKIIAADKAKEPTKELVTFNDENQPKIGEEQMNNTIKLASKMWESPAAIQWGINTNKKFSLKCRYCGHAISTPDAVAHGSGSICRRKHEKDAFLMDIEKEEEGVLQYLEQPGLFTQQKFEMNLKVAKAAHMLYTKWGKPAYLSVAASAINRMMADKEVAEYVTDGTDGAKGKIWMIARTIQNKDETALKHYFS